MIAKITLENFFSFGKATTIELNPDLNILVGINGSGKSNFLKAIHLLKEAVVGEGFEKVFLRDWGGFDSVANFGENLLDIKLTFEFNKDAIKKAVNNQGWSFKKNVIYEISIHKIGKTSYSLSEQIFYAGENGKDSFFMKMHEGKGIIRKLRISEEESSLHLESVEQNYFKSSELVLRQISEPKLYFPFFTLKNAIEKSSTYNYFDLSLKSPIRLPGVYGTDNQLLSNGENLISILMQLKNNHYKDYIKIKEHLKEINPHFEEIDFHLFGSKAYLVLREQHLNKSVSIEHISDGTLRYLLLLSILFNTNNGNLIVIDEPEIALHPDMIHTITQAIKYASRNNSQMFIATHSPLFLNAFELDEVLIFEKDRINQTRVSTKSEEDFVDWNENSLLGQFWLSGHIGGTRW